MTHDTLTQGQALLLSIDGLTALKNNLAGTSSTLQRSDNQQIPGIDNLIQEAFTRGIIKPEDIQPLVDLMYKRAADMANSYQAQFYAL